MRLRLKRVSALLFSIIIIFSSSVIYANGEGTQIPVKDLEYLRQIIEFVKANYAGEITEEELIEGAIKGVFSKLDKYSNYYSPEEFKEFNTSVSGNFGGVGIQITEKDGYITVISPINGTPGAKAGIKPGDRIVTVDDIDIKGVTVDRATSLIRGKPGTQVKLGVIRKGVDGIIYFNITREIIKVNPITYKIMDNGIGYIRISQFNSNTYENLKNILKIFDEKNIKKLIIDLRNNPGGYLDEVVDVLQFFVPEGPIVNIRKADGTIETYNSNLEKPKYKLAVLVNGGSASASEIFAGAIQDSKAGIIIGTTTYGKGTVQTVFPLVDGSGIKMTIAEYLTPKMRKVNEVGIKPDIVIENTLKPKVDLSKIPTLDKTRKPTMGVVGLDVLGAEMILEILGYKVNKPDGVFDEATFEAIKKFQKDHGLYSYGVLDFTTQDALTKAIIEYARPDNEDKQLQKAVEVLLEE
ncbi:S41 family peptidase [Caloranaerobacter azorensis]|uniref:S41 family peptidase n=1 Tax=Caloranaerobacter azorensis TaxID=116090 RepID=UPI0018CCF188|nr:S41 family peptidase [Caloranaerobacter azorensis]